LAQQRSDCQAQPAGPLRAQWTAGGHAGELLQADAAAEGGLRAPVAGELFRNPAQVWPGAPRAADRSVYVGPRVTDLYVLLEQTSV